MSSITVEQVGYRVVATLASGVDAQPMRFVSTLGSGQRTMISLPQAVGQPSLDFLGPTFSAVSTDEAMQARADAAPVANVPADQSPGAEPAHMECFLEVREVFL